jgi:hypothetical protein
MMLALLPVSVVEAIFTSRPPLTSSTLSDGDEIRTRAELRRRRNGSRRDDVGHEEMTHVVDVFKEGP